MNTSSNTLTATAEKSLCLAIVEDRSRNLSLILKQSQKSSSLSEILDIKERIKGLSEEFT
jgi:hypothetical protein